MDGIINILSNNWALNLYATTNICVQATGHKKKCLAVTAGCTLPYYTCSTKGIVYQIAGPLGLLVPGSKEIIIVVEILQTLR